jgi:hypothetical protein
MQEAVRESVDCPGVELGGPWKVIIRATYNENQGLTPPPIDGASVFLEDPNGGRAHSVLDADGCAVIDANAAGRYFAFARRENPRDAECSWSGGQYVLHDASSDSAVHLVLVHGCS